LASPLAARVQGQTEQPPPGRLEQRGPLEARESESQPAVAVRRGQPAV